MTSIAAAQDLEKQLIQFKLNHYLNVDFDYWQHKITQLHNRFERLKDPKKQKRVILELYTSYLQLLEIVFINAHALSLEINGFPGALFIKSDDLRKFVEDNFKKNTKFSTWFLTNYIFAIQKGDKDYKERYGQYTNIIKECAKDYIDNYQLLNAYKHGYRIHAVSGKTSIGLMDKNGQNLIMNEADSTITYYLKEPVRDARDPNLVGKQAIYERKFSFKNARVFGKSIFSVTLLQNARLTILNVMGSPTKEKIARFHIDKNKWPESHGEFSFKRALFSLAEKQKKVKK